MGSGSNQVRSRGNPSAGPGTSYPLASASKQSFGRTLTAVPWGKNGYGLDLRTMLPTRSPGPRGCRGRDDPEHHRTCPLRETPVEEPTEVVRVQWSDAAETELREILEPYRVWAAGETDLRLTRRNGWSRSVPRPPISPPTARC
jgi:hypothetical protein